MTDVEFLILPIYFYFMLNSQSKKLSCSFYCLTSRDPGVNFAV